MSFQNLNDPVTDEPEAYMNALVTAKFCNMGVVTSKKWFPCYIVIIDGIGK